MCVHVRACMCECVCVHVCVCVLIFQTLSATNCTVFLNIWSSSVLE